MVNNYPLYMRNKFIKAIENSPSTSETQLIIKWDMEENQFNTKSFHPRQAEYKLGIEELDRVGWFYPGSAVLVADPELPCVQQLQVVGSFSSSVHGGVVVPHLQGLAQVRDFREPLVHGVDK